MGPAQTIAGGLVDAVGASRLRLDRCGSKRLNAAKGEACKLYIVTAGERQGNGYSAGLGGCPEASLPPAIGSAETWSRAEGSLKACRIAGEVRVEQINAEPMKHEGEFGRALKKKVSSGRSSRRSA